MKKILLLITLSIISIKFYATELVLIPTANFKETQTLFEDLSIIIHFYRDEFVIASVENEPKQAFISLDKNPWQENKSYYIVYACEFADKNTYISSINSRTDVLYDGGFFIFVRTDEKRYGQLPPAQNGMVIIFNQDVKLPEPFPYVQTKDFTTDPFILELFEEVNGEKITDRVQHLEDYGTRDAYHSQSVVAQEWIESQFLEWGLEVEVMGFDMPGGDASDNVIATLKGTKNPDEFIVLGGHYDSVNWQGGDEAPGADDNASGTSGVMEVARILSQYEFDRSIVFCAFSGEEYGLYGSSAYATRSANERMNILGYFNIDMIGYLEPGNSTIMTSLIYPQSAKQLADFYTDVCEVYLPDFVVEPATLSGGDSDHTSFNNNGYMGIFPFEDVDNYSPYIHTADDIVGLSYNNEEQAVIFTKAVMASVVTLANLGINLSVEDQIMYTSIYPNPANLSINIMYNNNQSANLIISNLAGQIVKETTFNSNKTIDVSTFPKGIYLFQIKNDHFREVHKVIVN